MIKAFVSWSGGKDASLACYRAMKTGKIEVRRLLNMVSEDSTRSRSHGLSSSILRMQAKKIGIPILQKRSNWKEYEKNFKEAISGFKKEGIDTGIFGDIELQEHRDWIERVCKDMQIKPILPLWKEEREKLVKEFIRVGFKAIVVATESKFLGQEWLGRRIDREFIKELKALKKIDLCGEDGEFHTFVYDGPIFKEPLEVITRGKYLKDKHFFLRIEGR